MIIQGNPSNFTQIAYPRHLCCSMETTSSFEGMPRVLWKPPLKKIILMTVFIVAKNVADYMRNP
jgi:hypothetical protein